MLCLAGCVKSVSMQSGPVTSESVTTDREGQHRVILLLPLQGKLGEAGRAIRDGFMAAYHQQSPQDITISAIDTTKASSIQAAYQRAVEYGANTIVGPLDKKEVIEIGKIGALPVTTLVLNYLPRGTKTTENLYQFGLSPLDEAEQVAEKAWQDGQRNALMIIPDSEWGRGVGQVFEERWRSLGGRVLGILYVGKQDLAEQLKPILNANPELRRASVSETFRQDVEMVFLVAPPMVAAQIRPLLQLHHAGHLPIYATSMVYQGGSNEALDGIIFCDLPWELEPANELHTQLAQQYQQQFIKNSRLYALGIDAYEIVYKKQWTNTHAIFPGMTGTLYLTPQHQFLRTLQWAEFRNGKPRLLGLGAEQ